MHDNSDSQSKFDLFTQKIVSKNPEECSQEDAIKLTKLIDLVASYGELQLVVAQFLVGQYKIINGELQKHKSRGSIPPGIKNLLAELITNTSKLENNFKNKSLELETYIEELASQIGIIFE